MKTVAWYRDIGPVTATRYDELYLWHQDRGLWRILIVDELGVASETSDVYVTKAEAFASLEETYRVRVAAT